MKFLYNTIFLRQEGTGKYWELMGISNSIEEKIDTDGWV
jgi:hypothetical protein